MNEEWNLFGGKAHVYIAIVGAGNISNAHSVSLSEHEEKEDV